MVSIQNLTPFSETCLKLFLERFPGFEPYVCASDYDEGAWYAEMPWPDGWDAVGLCARTRGGIYGEEFQVDIGNWHTHFGDYSENDTFEFLDKAFELIDDFLKEHLVMIAKWIKSSEFISEIREPDYVPDESDWTYDILEIWRRSWNGKHNCEWQR